MTQETLSEKLEVLYTEMDERLETFPPTQQQQYLEGLFDSFDIPTRYGNLDLISFVGKERLINHAKLWAYNNAESRGLDTESKLDSLMEVTEGDETFLTTLANSYDGIYMAIMGTIQDDLSMQGGLGDFYDQTNERIDELSKEEQQLYFEGLIYGLNTLTQGAEKAKLVPFEREEFISSAKSWAYSRTHHLELDPESRMKGLIATDKEGVYKCMNTAATLQKLMGIPISFDQTMTLKNVTMAYQFGL
jgi:hypothetical protein